MWKDVHYQLTRLAQLSARYDLELGRMLLAGLRHQVHGPMGFDSFADYAEAMFGMTAPEVAARVRVADALTELPLMAAALADGVVRWSAVRELTRVATPGTEAAWLEMAEGSGLDRVRSEVRRADIYSDFSDVGRTSGPLGSLDVHCEQADSSSLTSKQPEPIEAGTR